MIALRKFKPIEAVISLFYPPVCTICGANVGPSEYLCEACNAKAKRIVPPFCEICSEPFPGAITDAFTCANCGNRKLYFETAVAVYRSRGIVRRVIHDFKYSKQLHLRHVISRWLADALDDIRLQGQQFDALVPVPLHAARQRERGFNQAELLAELVSRRLSIRPKLILKRIRYTKTQTAFDRAERMENLRDAFRLRKNANVRGYRVLLIDDVLTTGSTLSECARVLKAAGAVSVYAATAARA